MGRVAQEQSKIRGPSRGRSLALGAVVLVLAAGLWLWRDRNEPSRPAGAQVVPVAVAAVVAGDVPVRLTANGTVAALQSVEVRAQISATIKAVHFREGESVQRGQRLFSLDVRTEDANIRQAEAQLARSRADLANAESNLQRQLELFGRKFISASALDVAQSQVDSLRAQVAADLAAIDASRVGRGFGEILAPIAGRTGAVAVYPGSLVQPSGPALVGITRIDPINVVFTLPERELPGVQAALEAGGLKVGARLGEGAGELREGQLVFVDNSVDVASGTIRLKAQFDNPDARLWPGMFVAVELAPRILRDVPSVPVQAVQTGPEQKFVYVIAEDGKVAAHPVRVLLIQDGRAAIEGVAAGARVVVEGAQNLRPGSRVVEAAPRAPGGS